MLVSSYFAEVSALVSTRLHKTLTAASSPSVSQLLRPSFCKSARCQGFRGDSVF